MKDSLFEVDALHTWSEFKERTNDLLRAAERAGEFNRNERVTVGRCVEKMLDDTEWNLADNLKHLRGSDVLEDIVISCLQKARSLVLNEDVDRDTGMRGRDRCLNNRQLSNVLCAAFELRTRPSFGLLKQLGLPLDVKVTT